MVINLLCLAEVAVYCLSYGRNKNSNLLLGRRRGNFKVGFHVPANKRNELVIFDLGRLLRIFVLSPNI